MQIPWQAAPVAMRVARLATLCVVCAWASAVNEEAKNGLDSSRRAEALAVENMTLESAIHILHKSRGLHASTLALIQETIVTHRHNHKHKHKHGHHNHLRKHAEHAKKGVYENVKAQVVRLSEQLAETQMNWDNDNAHCCEERKTLDTQMEQLDEAISQANADAGRAQQEILRANKMISQFQDQIPEEKDASRNLKGQCESDKANLKHDLVAALQNLDSVDQMDMPSCGGGTAGLLQCTDPSGKESFLMLNHSTTRRSAKMWQSPTVQRFLKSLRAPQSGNSVYESSGQQPVVFLQMEEHSHPHKCTMEANPECEQVQGRYLSMTSDEEDAIDMLHEKQSEGEMSCEQNNKNIIANIDTVEQRLKEQETALAEATAEYNQAMEASRLKNEEREDKLVEMKKQSATCHDKSTGYMAERNGLVKIRGELINMNSIPNIFIQDCKVTDWTLGECTESCGGGQRTKTRTVLVQKAGDGAGCPPLVAQESCNTQKCPINCVMGEWGGWSACSAKCGGGVNERVRDIKIRAAHGGKPCDSSQETQSCNPQSCDADCELSRWSEWSECSKACEGGVRYQVREVTKAAEGQGSCPEEHSHKRLRAHVCNEHPCLKGSDKDKVLKCDSTRDVVLLIDGSAAVRTSGWEKIKKAAEEIVKSMGPEINLAVELVSGPKDREKYFKCTGQRWPNRQTGDSLGTPDMETECLLKWVTHFTTDMSAVSTAIQSMAWPRGSSLMYEGLSMAETELSNGRGDAKSVVIVVTDGKPMNKRKVSMASTRLRRKAQLMWVAVEENTDKHTIRQWSSRPYTDNAIFVKDYDELSSKKTINKIISGMCMKMEPLM